MNPSAQNLSTVELSTLKEGILQRVKALAAKPFKVSIIGQTGVGKSSLLNALFKTALKTDPVKPCTKEIEEIKITNNSGGTLLFYDLPGVGESVETDAHYLQLYREHLLESDVVLWAIHVDNRSVTFDLHALNSIMDGIDRGLRAQIMSKLTFVLTKADILSTPPWFLLKMSSEVAKFLPSKETMEILNRKSDYYQSQFFRDYGNLTVSRTYNDTRFDIQDGYLTTDKSFVYYSGFLDSKTLFNLKEKYPQHTESLERLYDNYQVIPCSAAFRFNLNKLLLVIVNKLGEEAVIRFRKFFDAQNVDTTTLVNSKKFCNITVYEPSTKKTLFDFANLQF